VSTEKVSAKEVLAMVESGKPVSAEAAVQWRTITRALRVLAAAEEVDVRLMMDALRSDGWNNSSQIMRFLGTLAALQEDKP